MLFNSRAQTGRQRRKMYSYVHVLSYQIAGPRVYHAPAIVLGPRFFEVSYESSRLVDSLLQRIRRHVRPDLFWVSVSHCTL